ncbi:MAG TPA: peptidylprolyl isomerase [Bacillota bacterium]
MRNFSKWTVTIVAVVATLIVAGVGGFALGARSVKPDLQSVASVNGDSITKTQLYNKMVKDYGAQTVDGLITDLLLDQQLKKAGATVTDAEISAEVKKLEDRFGGQSGLDQALQSNGMTLAQLKDNILFQLKVQKIIGKDVPTDDAALQKYFQDNLAQFDKRELHARHILVATEAEAKTIKAQLDKGGDFAALAKQKSTDDTNKNQGGDLGTFGRNKMDPDFEKAAFALKVNEVSQPVQSQYGWHIVQVLEIKGTAPTFEASKNYVKEAVIAQGVSAQYQTWMDSLKATAKISNSLEKK